MPYYTLASSTRYLNSETGTIQAQPKAVAEAFATAEIDRLFDAWDRSNWATTVPFEIAEIAELLSAGKYFEVAYLKPGLTDEADTKPIWKTLLDRGYGLADRVISMGGPWQDSDRIVRLCPVRNVPFGRSIGMEPL